MPCRNQISHLLTSLYHPVFIVTFSTWQTRVSKRNCVCHLLKSQKSPKNHSRIHNWIQCETVAVIRNSKQNHVILKSHMLQRFMLDPFAPVRLVRLAECMLVISSLLCPRSFSLRYRNGSGYTRLGYSMTRILTSLTKLHTLHGVL